MLSGDVQTAGVSWDNSYHVITVDKVNVLLDGLTIKAGNANGTALDARRGGGISATGNLTLADCVLTENAASDGGGAVAIWEDLGVTGRSFSDNDAGAADGAIGLYTDFGSMASTVEGSGFIDNNAVRGGALVRRGLQYRVGRPLRGGYHEHRR